MTFKSTSTRNRLFSSSSPIVSSHSHLVDCIAFVGLSRIDKGGGGWGGERESVCVLFLLLLLTLLLLYGSSDTSLLSCECRTTSGE